MKLFLIRHGECVKKESDVTLTKKGMVQAKQIAKKLKGLEINKVYTSTQTRALQTLDPFLKENSEVQMVKTEKLKEIYRALVGGPPKKSRPNRKEEDKKRAEEIIKELFDHKGKNIAVFCHGNIIRYIISKVLVLKPKELWTKLVISCGSITLIEKEGEMLRIKMINNIEHLSKKEIKTFYEEPLTEENYFP